MPFIIEIILFIIIFNLKDTEEDRLKKEKKEWKKIMGRDYE